MHQNQQSVIGYSGLYGWNIAHAPRVLNRIAILDHIKPAGAFVEIGQTAAGKKLTIANVCHKGRAALDLIFLRFNPKLMRVGRDADEGCCKCR